MNEAEILIVEDEWMIADFLKSCLVDLGYSVTAMVGSGEAALKSVADHTPDLILMDIVLQGSMDGIETTRTIMSSFDIPVVYLTAYADEAIVVKARETGAYGYLVKPFKDSELKATIELALYKHRMEKKLKESENRLYTTLKSINDAVISTDEYGRVKFMNALAQFLTGWNFEEADGKPIKEIFDIRSSDHKPESLDVNLSGKLVQGPTVTEQVKYMLKTKEIWDMYIELSSAPILDDKGSMKGTVIAFRDITNRVHTEKELDKYREHLEEIVKERTIQLTKSNEELLKEISERILVEEQINASLKEKEVLLTEINHRVGNNLQVIYGMLMMQSDYTSDPRCIDIFRGCQNRIMAMALVHDILYKSKDVAHLKMKDYINRLVNRLYKSYGVQEERVALLLDIVDLSVSIDIAITGGLIVNEFVSNSLIHAFPDGRKGEVRICIMPAGDRYELTVADNGIGLPDDIDFRNTSTFGLKTVTTYENRKSWGQFELNRENGTEFKVLFQNKGN